MENLESARLTLDALYEAWRKGNWTLARLGFMWVPASLSCIPYLIWWTQNNTNMLLFLIVISIISYYLYIKNTRIIKSAKHQINEIESNLLSQHQLHYCGCDILSHYFNADNEKLWNIKSNIYFDTHKYSIFNKWHNSFHDPTKGSKLGNKVATVLAVLLVILAITNIA